MNIIDDIQSSFLRCISTLFHISIEQIQSSIPTINTDEKKQVFGDLNSNAPMVLAKKLKQPPLVIAQTIKNTFHHEAIERIEIAGGGFLNFYLHPTHIGLLAHTIFNKQDIFFQSPDNHHEKICIEFVSANPTGPLHFGHGRGGIIGDVLANILQFHGHQVHKEFYVNDAGKQIVTLGQSFKIRCQQLLNIPVTLPEDAYHGTYLIELATQCVQEMGNDLLTKPDTFFQSYAKEALLAHIKNTLTAYGITFDLFFSEETLHKNGSIKEAINLLEQNGYVYEHDGALWFKSTAFEDDKDRVIRKASGEYTYVAADIAYMQNKAHRGYDRLIMILGHDHHSYAVRMQGIRKALKIHPHLDVLLYQLVNIKEGEQQVRLSKRAGRIISLDDVIETVGKDVARFFYLNRNADAQLDFDLTLAATRSEENPAFYIQYAYVRTNSILKRAHTIPALNDICADDAIHLGTEESLLIKKIASLKTVISSIEKNHQTYQLAFYTYELAQLFSTYYAKHKIVNPDDIPKSRGRLAMVTIINNTLDLCCRLLGISRPESM